MESINRFKVNMQDMMVEVNEQSIIIVQSNEVRKSEENNNE